MPFAACSVVFDGALIETDVGEVEEPAGTATQPLGGLVRGPSAGTVVASISIKNPLDPLFVKVTA
jgi:hypothetical protein